MWLRITSPKPRTHGVYQKPRPVGLPDRQVYKYRPGLKQNGENIIFTGLRGVDISQLPLTLVYQEF